MASVRGVETDGEDDSDVFRAKREEEGEREVIDDGMVAYEEEEGSIVMGRGERAVALQQKTFEHEIFAQRFAFVCMYSRMSCGRRARSIPRSSTRLQQMSTKEGVQFARLYRSLPSGYLRDRETPLTDEALFRVRSYTL